MQIDTTNTKLKVTRIQESEAIKTPFLYNRNTPMSAVSNMQDGL